jgi:phosphotransferase system enzyme I (PtsI)
MCGEMASDPRYIFVLLGFGFDQLSMVSSMVPWIKNIIRSSRHHDAERLVRRLMEVRDSKESEELLTAWIQERYPNFERDILSVQ